jgi:hypothetical protein
MLAEQLCSCRIKQDTQLLEKEPTVGETEVIFHSNNQD